MERIRFAALKLSAIDKLLRAIDLARADWRDLLMDARFGDVEAHDKWAEEILGR